MEGDVDGKISHVGPCPLKRWVFVVLTDIFRHSIQKLG